ncbi:KGGVGR-motif variant AAA ATPase [Pantoea sp. C2G6]|uniref:KGGVGR-motif variant AAA ATPase n=1 Tax=Pantoea sp. C2G6 TaxID=3243084 RepID=UPI003ED86542
MKNKLLTWIDVEREIKKFNLSHPELKEYIVKVDCYSDAVEVQYRGDVANVKLWIGNIFGDNYNKERDFISVGPNDAEYEVLLIEGEDSVANVDTLYPLWKEHAYNSKSTAYPTPWSGGAKVVAFHSFKGGVGRTTSLMTYVSAVVNENENTKILLIDADLEAPGISFWLNNELSPTVSFLKFIEALHYRFGASEQEVIKYFGDELFKKSIVIDGGKKEVFTLPSALDITNIMDMPVTPEHISKNLENPWILSDYIKKLADYLEVDVAFVDLRAGLSELSSPLIFDPRIEHFFVTTIAPQSILGMKEILSKVYASHSNLKDELPFNTKPSIVLSLLTDNLKKLKDYSNANEILNSAYPGSENDVVSPGVEWLEFEHNESLMSIGSIKDALDKLKQASLYSSAKEWAVSIRSDSAIGKISNASDTQSKLSDAAKLHETCKKFQFAEDIESNDLLITDPLRNLAKHYYNELPVVVSIGAKGAGKTFTYIQLCLSEDWDSFVRVITPKNASQVNAKIYPLLSSLNINQKVMGKLTTIRDDIAKSYFFDGEIKLSSAFLSVRSALEKDTDWESFWIKLILSQFGKEELSLQQFNDFLVENDKSIVFVIDGIEDIIDDPVKDDNHRNALKALLYLPNVLTELTNRRIGLVSFVRADYVQAVIKQNHSQYVSRFQQFRLEWTPETFLRLAYWICGKAGIIDANIEHAETKNLDSLLSELEKLWGKKLGRDTSKEAHSARWVFAALCDLNGKLQARDLVRFLKFSAELMSRASSINIKPELWVDRVLAPEAIRRSLEACSKEKVDEAIAEIRSLREWAEILSEVRPESKKVPFNPIDVGLTLVLISSLRELGIVYEDTDHNLVEERYYLPEIYRWGLNFSSAQGGRPRVQALLKRNLGGMPF